MEKVVSFLMKEASLLSLKTILSFQNLAPLESDSKVRKGSQDNVIGDVPFPVCYNDNCQAFS